MRISFCTRRFCEIALDGPNEVVVYELMPGKTQPLDRPAILSARLERQRLASPIKSRKDYVPLFRSCQPVSPIYNTAPGSPPSLRLRTAFNDAAEADKLRADRIVVKGRFLGGGIGYVHAADLGLYANAFRKAPPKMDEIQEVLFDIVSTSSGITARLLKKESGFLNKQIMPALHRLQQSFLVYEDQIDDSWGRGWYDFAAEWPDVEISDELRPAAIVEVVARFIGSHFFATFEQIRDWSQLPPKDLKWALQSLEEAGRVLPLSVKGLGDGWIGAEDASTEPPCVAPSAFMLHKADFLVRSHASEIKRRFESMETLQYLLIDGEFLGAVVGHWRIGPHNVDDIVLEIPRAQRAKRKEEILHAVEQWYRPPYHRILKYDSKDLS